MEMCRACLSSDMNMTTMDESFLHNYKLLTNLDIEYTDIPIYLCDECLNALKYCIEFREKCITSDITLKQILFPDENIKLEDVNDERDIKMLLVNDTFFKEEMCDGDNDETKYLVIPEDGNDDWEPIKKSSRSKRKTEKLKDVKKLIKKATKKIKQEVYLNNENIVKRYKSDEPITNCGLCKEIFEDKHQVIKHLGVHKMNVVCLLCQTRCVSYPHLLAHRMAHIPRAQSGCLYCNKRFPTQSGLEFHYLKTHNLGDENTLFLCKVCLKSYETPLKLSKHVRAVHRVPIDLKCKYCILRFSNKSNLKVHMATHNIVKKYECDNCEFRCRFRNGIVQHILRIHTKSRVYCKPCGRIFLNQAALDKHVCTSQIGVICPICGSNFKNKNALSRHIHIHTDIKRYSCELCQVQYKTKLALKVHMDKHAGTKRQHCEYCPLSFYSRSVLIKHRRVHTGEKPYVCGICTRAFTGNHNLKLHMRVHGLDVIVKKPKSDDVKLTV